MRTRHKWIDKHGTYGSHRATCANCGMIRDQRFAASIHWTEISDDNGETWKSVRQMPPCQSREPDACPHCPLKDDEEIYRNEAGGMHEYESYWHDPKRDGVLVECIHRSEYWKPVMDGWEKRGEE